MKTAHQFARELLAGPDLPLFHFDPSRAGMDAERDTSVSEPRIERVAPEEVQERDHNEPFLIVHGDGGEPADESGAFAELTIESLLNLGFLDRITLEAARDHTRAIAAKTHT